MKYVLLLHPSLPLLFSHVSADSSLVVTSVPLLFYYYVMGETCHREIIGNTCILEYTTVV